MTFPSRRAILYALAFVFLGILLWRSQFWESGDEIKEMPPATLILIPLISLATVVPLAIRQRTILQAIGHRYSAVALAPITFYGNTVGFMTPAASGEILRPSMFERIFGIPTAQGVAVVLYERLFSMALFGLSCLFALAWTRGVPLWMGVVASAALAVGCLVPAAAVKLVTVYGDSLRIERLASLVPAPIRRRFGDGARDSGAALRVLWGSASLAVPFAVLSGSVFLLMAGQFWLIQDGLGQELSLQEAWVILAASSMAGLLSGLPFGLGATDAVMLSLLRAYGVDFSTAGSVVILMRTLMNLPSGLAGLGAYLITLRQTRREPPNGGSPPLVVATVGDKR